MKYLLLLVTYFSLCGFYTAEESRKLSDRNKLETQKKEDAKKEELKRKYNNYINGEITKEVKNGYYDTFLCVNEQEDNLDLLVKILRDTGYAVALLHREPCLISTKGSNLHIDWDYEKPMWDR